MDAGGDRLQAEVAVGVGWGRDDHDVGVLVLDELGERRVRRQPGLLREGGALVGREVAAADRHPAGDCLDPGQMERAGRPAESDDPEAHGSEG